MVAIPVQVEEEKTDVSGQGGGNNSGGAGPWFKDPADWQEIRQAELFDSESQT
jgi:hypothetical protein